jgi:site-specific DNA recombinase
MNGSVPLTPDDDNPLGEFRHASSGRPAALSRGEVLAVLRDPASSAKLRDIIYIRVSTQRQHDEGLSEEEQERVLRALSARTGGVVVAVLRDVISGMRADRDDYQELLAMVARGEADRVLVWKFDRFGRDEYERLSAEITLTKAGIQIVSELEGVLDRTTPEGMLMAGVLRTLAQFESMQIGQRVRPAKLAKLRKGYQPTSRYVALGFKAGPDGASKPVICQDTAPLAIRIWTERAAGRSFRKIAQGLTSDEVPTASGKKIWHVSMLTKMLANPIYIGCVRDPETGDLIDTNEPLIDQETWERVQALNATVKAMPGNGRGARRPHVLSGLLWCSECEQPFIVRSGRHDRRAFYVCKSRALSADLCSMPLIPVDEADAYITEFWLARGVDYDATRQQIADAVDQRRAEVRALQRQADLRLMKVEDSLNRVKRDYTDGEITAADWRELRGELEADLETARAEAERYADQVADADALMPDDALIDALDGLRDAVANGVADPESVEAVRAALARVFVHFRVERLMEPSSLDPSMGSEWKVSEAMKNVGFDLVPVLRPEVDQMPRDDEGLLLPTPLAVRSEKSTSPR